MENTQIFDKDGNKLEISDVIYNFIKDKAKENNKYIEDVFVGVDICFAGREKPDSAWIYTTESVENGYDGLDLNSFGESIEVNRA